MRRTIRALSRTGLLVAGLLALGGPSSAQTTITTAGGTNYTGANGVTGNSALTFAVQNTNATGIIIQSVQVFLNPLTVTAPTSCTLWATTTSLSGAPTVSSPTWTSIATATVTSVPSAAYYNVFNGMSYAIPASSTVRFAVQSSTGITYSGAAGPPTPNTFTSGGVTLLSGGAQISGLNVGYGGAFPSPANNPRWFTGSITFVPQVPCTAPPTAGTTVATVNPVCSGSTTTLSLSGASTGTGLTYQWTLNGGAIGGANSSTYSPTITASGSYGCDVTCSGQTTSSTPLLISLNTSVFPENFSSATFPPNCFSKTDAGGFLTRSTANGFAAPGTGSAVYNCFNASSGTVMTLTTPTFSASGTSMQLSFDVAGATYTGGEVDQMIVEASLNGGTTWPTTVASLNNNPTNGLMNPTHLATTASYVPTTSGEWSTLTYLVPAGTNRIRWRCVSNFGNLMYVDNINLVAPPACPAPTFVSVSNITGFNADVNWTCTGCTGQYYVEFGAPGFTPGTTAAAGAGGTVQGPFSGNPATITVPSALTTYTAYVRQDCGGGSFSANSSPANFISGCGAASSCTYNIHLTDNFGDGWNGATVELRQNGLLAVTLGPQVVTCEATVNQTLCDAVPISLVCTAIGSFPDEPGLTLTDPFGVVLFQKRGTTTYTSAQSGNTCNDLTTYPTPSSLSDMTLGTLYSTTSNCTPPPCPTPQGVMVSNISGTNADVSWNCTSCTGQFYIEYGTPGFSPGTGSTPGGGTVFGPFSSSPQTITVASALTAYDVYVRQDCAGSGLSGNSNVVTFSSGCSGTSCAYQFHLTDNFGDGWNGATVEVRQNGVLAGTLGPQLLDCETTVNVNVCDGATLDLICTNTGFFPDEPGITMYTPFGDIVYEQIGTTTYPGNCNITYPNPSSPQDMTLGTLFTGTANCTPPPCVDPPTAGTISGPSSICSGSTASLSMSNGTAIGLLRQWQSSSTGTPGSWTSISGASNQAYTTDPLTSSTYFRFYLDCGAGSDTSAAFLVNVSLSACYCVPVHTVGCGNGNITNVTLNTLNNSSACSPPAYQAYAPTGTATTTLQQGVSYNLSVTTDDICIISVWVDWDHNNVFDASEWTQVTVGSDGVGPSTVSLPVPVTAPLGATAMRIRSRFSGNPNGATDACTSFGSGESEDYVITIDPAPPCLPASAITFSNVTSGSVDVNWTNATNSCGTTTYTVEYGPVGFTPGTGTSLAPVSAGPVTIMGLSAETVYDVYVTRDCNSCGDGVSPSTLGTTVTYPDCNTAQPIACPFGNGLFGANHRGAWDFVEPLFGFTTVGAEQLFFLDASVLGNYTMSLTANAGNSIVAIYIKPVGGPCDNTGWTYVGTNQFTVQTFNFPISTIGQYYVLVDPVSASLDISTYLVSFVCPPQNIDCSTAIALNCGDNITSTTSGVANSLPPSACPYSTSPSTGGSLWYTFTSPTNQRVTFSTCDQVSYDTRISVFDGPDCSNLSCLALNDDGPGCPNFSSEVSINAQAGVTYYVVIHGFGSSEGVFRLFVSCAPECTPAVTNDYCPDATTIPSQLQDGSETFTHADNSCATVDLFTSCESFAPVQGQWYTFTTGQNTLYKLTLNGHIQTPANTAATLSYALYSGACDGNLSATGELDCQLSGDGVNDLTLTPATTYRLLVWNNGGITLEGSYDVQLSHPPMNDAVLDSILQPSGTLCSTTISPVVRLVNNGETALTSVTFTYNVDGGTPVVYHWTGNIPYQGSADVSLPDITATVGPHTLNVSTSNPNGVADEIPSSDSASLSLDITGESVVVRIQGDANGSQVSWELLDAFSFPVASGNGTDNALSSVTACLPTTFGNCYTFHLLDPMGDGLCCMNGNGYWELRTLGNKLLLRDLFNSTPDGSRSPSNTPASAGYADHEFCLPAGPSAIQATECNIFTNTLLSKVYTTAVSGVLNYQFEFSDPDAGYRRRIAVPRNWVQFSEMVTNPLSPGVTYFARVRVDQGATGFADDYFGTGCEMGIDPNQVPGCTQLIDNPSLPTHSCGVTKRFNGSDKIWAVPVVNATQYRFNFSNPGEGYNRNILRSSYVCPLSWTTLPLVNGSTYQVRVECLVNGAWSGFCGATCNLTINNAHGPSRVDVMDNTTDVQLFPNPTRDGRFTIKLNGLSGADQQISVEMYDVFGNRVLANQYGNQGDTFNAIIDLDHGISTGIYLVNITVDGKTTTKRLSVL